MKIVFITALDEDIEIMKRVDKKYLIIRRWILFDDEEEDIS